MKPNMIARLTCDVLMTAALLLLMAYEMVGQAAHEWLGIGMFLLFLGHHILNIQWCKHICKGKYTAFRVFQTLIAALLLLCIFTFRLDILCSNVRCKVRGLFYR